MNTLSENQGIRVFLVEDHQCVLWGLERLVAGEQPRMQVAGKARNRAEAMEGVRLASPDIILLDLDLGGDNSLDFMPELLRQSQAQVLILTGLHDDEALERAVMLGARGIVLKDEPAEVLLNAIKAVHGGEFWLDRAMMARVLGTFTHFGPDAGKIDPLTPKERQIIRAIVTQRGAISDVIASDLCMSGHTLRNHLTTIYQKLGVKNRLELVMYAIEHHLAGTGASTQPAGTASSR